MPSVCMLRPDCKLEQSALWHVQSTKKYLELYALKEQCACALQFFLNR